MLQQDILERELPPLLIFDDKNIVTCDSWPKRRMELLDILMKNIYGYTPDSPDYTKGEIVFEGATRAFAGKVRHQTVRITFDTPAGEFSYPLQIFLPRNNPNPALFLHIAFRPDIPDIYCPIEEITDNGFALAFFCYKDVVNDNLHGDYSDGLGKLYIGSRKRDKVEWGKIGMWAYAASRALDYLITREDVDKNHIIVAGHSRLGKTALWCAAQDERFFAAISNDSGIGGAAVAKYSTGEKVSAFLRAGSWDWFCEKFKEYDGYENNMPYDQHYLLAAIAPRYICVGSAEIDPGADPKSEFLSCVAVSEVYRLLGYKGIVTPDEYPVPGTSLHEGEIGYHLRSGSHFFSRTDWIQYMSFFKNKILL